MVEYYYATSLSLEDARILGEKWRQDPFHLTLASVKKSAREWYDAGKLIAQHPTNRMCRNNGKDGHRCAVATAYPPKEEFPFEGTARSLCQLGFIKVNSLEELNLIADIQVAHDGWAAYLTEGHPEADEKEKIFLNKIA